MVILFSGNCGRSLYHFRLAAVKHLQDLGYDVIAVVPKDDYTQKLITENIKVVTLTELELSGTNPFKDYKLYKQYLSVYNSLKPDLIFQYTIKPHIFGTLAAKKLRIPCIAIVSGLGYTFTHKGTIATLAKKLYKFALSKTLQVWFSNDTDKHFFEQIGFVDKNKTVLLHSEGIDTTHYAYAPLNYSKKSFLLFGRLIFDKGLEQYYQAAKILKEKYPTVSFKILGFVKPDDPRSISEKQLKEWNDSGAIEYLGSTTNVQPFIKEATCVVLPSFYKEGMSTALMEAASMGRPLIATDIAGCKELINDNETGYICKIKNAENLAEKMELLINLNNTDLHAMSIKSRKKMIDEFDIQNILPKYENAIKHLNNSSKV